MGPPYGSPPSGSQQPPGPPIRGNGLKWVLGAVVLIVVVAVTVGATLLFTGGGSGDNPPTGTSSTPTTSGVASDVASASDDGPVAIITDDPSCSEWSTINSALANQQRNGWDRRDPALSAASWTPQQRAEHESVGAAMRRAADQTVALAKSTPHRVMRELYEQAIAYWRAYADRIPMYTPADDHLALASTSTSTALLYVCYGITYGSAITQAPSVPAAAPPSQLAPIRDPANPQILLATPALICPEWISTANRFNEEIAAWTTTNADIPASQWSPEQRSINDDVVPIMTTFADNIEDLGKRSRDPTIQDFSAFAATYQRAYVRAVPGYVPPDNALHRAAMGAVGLVSEACLAAGGH